MPMPIDVYVVLKDGSTHIYNIPLVIMRGEKPQEFQKMGYTVAADWPWTHPNYELNIPTLISNIDRIFIDASQRMADLENSNDSYIVKLSEGGE